MTCIIKIFLPFQICVFSVMLCFSQDKTELKKWDNQLYLGNKVAGGINNWRFSGELQVRLENNTQYLDNYFLEGVASYLLSENWEIVPDFRFAVKPDETEYRPGLGIVNKVLGSGIQLVNQLKWQIDLDSKGNIDNGLRYVVFLNYKANDHLIPNLVAGGFYRWQEDFQGIQFIRFGPGLAYVIDVKHGINFNYLISVKNTGNEWIWAGIPFIQLVININKNYKYLPAKYFNF